MMCESLEHNLSHNHKDTQYKQAGRSRVAFRVLFVKNKNKKLENTINNGIYNAY